MTDRQQKALNNLYAATVEVISAFSPEMVNDEMRYQSVASMLQNFLMGMGSINGMTGTTGGTGTSPEPNPDPIQNPGGNGSEGIMVDPVLPEKPKSEPLPAGEVRYAYAPADGGFRRPKKEVDKKELEESAARNGEPMPEFYFKLYLGDDDKGSFELMPQSAESLNLLLSNREEILDEKAVRIAGSTDGANSAITLERGLIEKDGKRWKIVKEATVEFKTV